MRMNHHNKNANALMLGIFLILLISAATFLRSYDKNKDVEEKKEAVENERSEMMKSASKISGEELSEKINTKDDILIIDLRDDISYSKEHIAGSKNMPASMIIEAAEGLDKDKQLILIDFGPENADVALFAGKMNQLGFGNVSYLDGGFYGWKNKYYSTTSSGDPNSFTDQSKVSYIQSDGLKKMIEVNIRNLALIDVRSNPKFREGHLKNAANIPLEELEKRKSEIPVGKKIVIYDDNGLLAFKAAVKLFDIGIFNVAALSDGLNGWKEKKYEVVK